MFVPLGIVPESAERLLATYKNAPAGVMETYVAAARRRPPVDDDAARQARETNKARTKAELDAALAKYKQRLAPGREMSVKRTSSGIAVVTTRPTAIIPSLPETAKGIDMPPSTASRPAKADTSTAGVVQPRITFTHLKAFGSHEAALDAGMAMLAGVCRAVPDRSNAIAENYCRKRNLAVLNVATTLSPTAGGMLVPDEMSAAIRLNMTRVGFTRKLATVVPMTSGTTTVPWEKQGLTVEYIEQAPSSAPTASDMGWGAINLIAEKRGVLGFVSSELDADALVAYADVYVDRASHALAKWEDRELVLADGTSTYGGEVGLIAKLGAAGIHQAASGHDLWSEIDVLDFVNTQALLPEQYADGRESWICSAAFYALGMLRSVGGASQGFHADGRPLFLGKPVNLLPAMPATATAASICALYGNWAESVALGDRGVAYAVSTQAPEVFDRDLIAVRAFSRYDLNVHNGGDASTAGGYVGLKTAA